MPQLITDTGNINLRNGSAKVSIWHCPRRGGQGGIPGKEKVLIAAAMDTSNPAVTKSGWTPARPAVMHITHGLPPVPADMTAHGKFQAETFTIPDNEIIKVSATLNAPWDAQCAGLGRTLAMPVGLAAMQFYRVRTGAAVITIKVRMISDNRCPTQFATITGPLERITIEQAQAAGVAPVPMHFRKGYDARGVDYLFSEQTLQAAASELQTVQQAQTGETVQAIIPAVRERTLILPARKATPARQR